MEVMTALDAKNQFGQLINAAQLHPVKINKHGRTVAYVISNSEYEKMKNNNNSILQEAILKANKEEAEDMDYQKELSSWDATLKDGLKN